MIDIRKALVDAIISRLGDDSDTSGLSVFNEKDSEQDVQEEVNTSGLAVIVTVPEVEAQDRNRIRARITVRVIENRDKTGTESTSGGADAIVFSIWALLHGYEPEDDLAVGWSTVMMEGATKETERPHPEWVLRAYSEMIVSPTFS